MLNIQSDFYKWFLNLVIEWLLSQQFSGNVRIDEETVLAVLPHGQLTQRGAGAYFTPKQANKLPRRGEKLNIITVNGISYIGAMGDTRKRSPALRPMSRGGGVPVLPLPYQPVLSLALPEHTPDPYLLFEGGEPEHITASSATWDASVQRWRYMLPRYTLEATVSKLFNPEGEPLVWDKRHLVGKSVLPRRPLMLGYDPNMSQPFHSALKKSYWEGCNIFDIYEGAFWKARVPVPFDFQRLFVDEAPALVSMPAVLTNSYPNVYTERAEPDTETGVVVFVPEPLYPNDIDIGVIDLSIETQDFLPVKTEFQPYNDFPPEYTDFGEQPFSYPREMFVFNDAYTEQTEPVVHEVTVPATGLGKIQQYPWMQGYALQSHYTSNILGPGGALPLTEPIITDVLYIFEVGEPSGSENENAEGYAVYKQRIPLGSTIWKQVRYEYESEENIQILNDLAQLNSNEYAQVISAEFVNTIWEYEYEETPPLIPPPGWEPRTFTGKASSSMWTFQLDREVVVSEHTYWDAGHLMPVALGRSKTFDGNDPDDPRPSARIYSEIFMDGWEAGTYRFSETYTAQAAGGWAQSAHKVGDTLEICYEPVVTVNANKVVTGEFPLSLPTGEVVWYPLRYFDMWGNDNEIIQNETMQNLIAFDGELIKGQNQNSTIFDNITVKRMAHLAASVEISDIPDFTQPVTEQFGDFTARYPYQLQGNLAPYLHSDGELYGVYYQPYNPATVTLDVEDPPPGTLPRWQPEEVEDGEEPDYPLVTTPEHQREIAFTLPYLYGYQYPGSAPNEGPYGLLPNPLSGITAGKWMGSEWEAAWYAADAFLGAFYDAEGNPSEKPVGVVIYRALETGDYRVLVSVAGVPVREEGWSLWDFFPGSVPTEGEPWLRFQNDEVWPPDNARPLVQTYNFCHPEWPFKDIAMLPPFRARLRNPLVDKVGKMFTPAAADCPVVLYLESFPDHDDTT